MSKEILHSKTVQTDSGEATYMVTKIDNKVMVERKFGDETTMICGTLGVEDGIKIVDNIAERLSK